ncbi:hypothetical protein AKJ09_04158 [Labilithrix luteola]|uniref:VWFA domain-containing protein n=1 Tax=Labilithrix luteola TaxID=1391654 RepID=A0A0K1PWH5_9BACT|nr:vWA domain-containing protein [Labilithrix luteola]AKU97494.1 hypothetical protein AKJ09_04158 [Labilithrix luteola]
MARWLTGVACGVFLSAVTAVGQGCGSEGATSLFDGGTPAAEQGESDGRNFGDGANRDGGVGSTDPLSSCATASAETNRTPVYMQLIIDGSGSMDGFDGTNYIAGEREPDPASPGRLTGKKWIAVRDALNAFFADLEAKPDPSMAVGMYLFSSTVQKSASKVDVPIAFVDAAQASALRARLAPPIFPNSGTPLYTAINGQLSTLKSYTPSAPIPAGGKYVLVVMTDGIPTDDTQGCITALDAAKKGNPEVISFAVGVGNEDADPATVYDEAFMAKLAQAGGTAVPGCNPNWGNADKSGTPCHFQITPGTKTAAQIRTDFLAAINAIRDTVTSCELPLVKPAGAGQIDPANVNVVFTSSSGTDTTIPQNAKDGWTYDSPTNPTKVTLHGDACDALKADPQGKVRIVIGCKTVVEVTK